MARAIAEKIDADPDRKGLLKARDICRRWYEKDPTPAIAEWLSILDRPWEEIRSILLEETENGQRLRQSDPFCGILTPQERWDIYRRFQENAPITT